MLWSLIYDSPVILVNKPNGKNRLCIDFRKLNSQTIHQPYPMPDVDAQLGSLAAKKIFWIFTTVPAKLKTAIITPDAVVKFECMPFGLRNALVEFFD